MSDEKKRIPIPKIFTEGGLQTQSEVLQINRKANTLFIGIPKETTLQESRVALVPSAVATLVSRGHRVVIESGAGEKANYTDHRYSEAGADIAYSKEQVYKSDIILKVAPLTLEEIDFLKPNQILFSPLHLPMITHEHLEKLKEKRVIAMAMEHIKDENNAFPFVRVMSEIAGVSIMLTAAELMSSGAGGKGVLLGGVSGVPSAKVVILGAGVIAEFATRVAIGLGAELRVFDDNISKLMRLQNQVGRQLNTSTFNPMQLEKELLTADVAIGAIHSPLGRTPVVVSEEIVSKMKPGAVIVDVSIDQGGCFATSELTTHDKPTFVKHDVIHYCVPNIPAKVSRTASIAVSNIFMSILLQEGESRNIESALSHDAGLRHGVYLYKGRLTNQYLSDRFGMKYTNLDLLITSNLG